MKRYLKVLLGIGVLLTAALLPVAAQEAGAPSVSVDSQAVVDGRVVIAKVVSAGAGWLVIHIQADGKPGPVIGFSPVRDGVNLNVAVDVDTAKVTESLFAMLHLDAGSLGVYEFPGPDAPVKASGGIVMKAFQVGESEVVRIDIKARKFEFAPNVIRVKAGTPVELHIVSEDGTHGIGIPGLKLNSRLESGKEAVLRFTPMEAGRYPFSCIVFCGSGHGKMRGELIVK